MKITYHHLAIDAEPIDGTLTCCAASNGTIRLHIRDARHQVAGITLMDPGELRELARALLVLAGNLSTTPGVNIDPTNREAAP